MRACVVHRAQEEDRIVKEMPGGVPAAGFDGDREIVLRSKGGISHDDNETYTTPLHGGQSAGA